MEKNNNDLNPELRKKLEEIARLEKENNVLGVSFAVRDDKKALLTEDVADYVNDVIKETGQLIKDLDSIEVRG